VNCIAFHPTDSNTFWIGAAAGGVWKTTDGGNNWETHTDKLQALGIASIAVHPEKSETLYAATGDKNR
jgi:photosystem II stability/assembly factor-like uncharacterized protein